MAGRLNTLRQSRHAVVSGLGLTQILGYGTTFYLLAVLAPPISADTGWRLEEIAAGLSIGLLIGGLAAPFAGRSVDRYGGRPVLAAGSIFFALGLGVMALSTNILLYWLAWGIVGLGMAAGLYEAAFSALGRWYRDAARAPITAVTLWGGFASTLCWPMSAWLVSAAGWRVTCLVYAGLHLLLALPVHAVLMPRTMPLPAAAGKRTEGARPPHVRPALFVLLAASLTFSPVIVTVVSVHLIPILQQHGFTAAAAVSIGALIGPSQVAGRLVELIIGWRMHPLVSALAAGLLMAAGILLLGIDLQLAAVAVVVYAMGSGVSYVVRGTLPLAMFGADGYATLMGRLTFPSLVGQALAPWAAALVLAKWDSAALMLVLLALALANVGAVLTLALARRRAT